MSGAINAEPVKVRIVYYEPWTDDDARRLILQPMASEMYSACAEIARRYEAESVKIGVV